jgi:serine/threonine-protein kinase
MALPIADSSLVPISPATTDLPVTLPPPGTRDQMRVPLVAGSSAQFTGEIQSLLRSRLRLAALIGLCAASIVFIWNNLDSQRDVFLMGGADWVLHLVVILVSALITGLLFSMWDFSLRSMRTLEVAMFATYALFFSFLMYGGLCDGGAVSLAAEGKKEAVVRLSMVPNTLRWFVLIVMYGTFIPNTWRRCALMVGWQAVLPIALMLWFGLGCPIVGPYLLPNALIDMTIFVGLAAAIAIFGSHKLIALHRQAFEARQLGQYRLREKLGFGGMGEVYLAEHRFLRRPCAIKLIRPDRAGDRNTLLRFEREVQATARLTHWNTVEIYDYGHAEDGTFYYVMEYLPGMNLQEMVYKHGPLPPERAIHLLRQVCAGLQEAHATGLIHRDIKPNNILVCERGGVQDVVKLVDFGLVQSSDFVDKEQRLTRQGAIAGSPPYMSPEQAKGLDQVDPRSDIYSIGAVAYYLLTGKPPFDRETAIETIAAHLRDTVIPPRNLRSSVPHDLQETVMTCLEKNPARRFQDVQSLDRSLARCQDAGQWTFEQAQEWWRQHPVETPASTSAASAFTNAHSPQTK